MKNNNLGIIIQARTGSTRLPSKMILPFYNGQGIFEILLTRLIDAGLGDIVVVATTNQQQDDIIYDIAHRKNIKTFRGDENDVLDRFIQTASQYHIDQIIRVCADNPFLDILALKELINFGTHTPADYISYCTSTHTPTIKTHYGFWAEYTSLSALKTVKSLTTKSLYHEHVTNYIYTHPTNFKIELHPIPIEIEQHDIRLTLDTLTDFQIQQTIFETIYKNNPQFQIKDILNYLNEHTDYYTIMRETIKANQK